MPDRFALELAKLIKVCLNDPGVRAEIQASLEGDPAPVGARCGTVEMNDRLWAVRLQTDRSKAPGEEGFLRRDQDGALQGLFREILASATPECATMSPEEMAASMNMSVAELTAHIKKED